jgi:hypothetical protein
VLSNGAENRLVIRARVDAAHSVETSKQARFYLSGQDAILGRCVESFEKRELLRVQRFSRVQRRNRLNDHVAVAYNEPFVVNGLQATQPLAKSCTKGLKGLRTCGAAKNLTLGLTKDPVLRFLIAISNVNV